jgi:hypothetical protein
MLAFVSGWLRVGIKSGQYNKVGLWLFFQTVGLRSITMSPCAPNGCLIAVMRGRCDIYLT